MTSRTHSRDVYHIRYPFVWYPKYHTPVLVDVIAGAVGEFIHQKVPGLGGSVLALEIQADHLHLFVKMPLKSARAQIGYRVKGYTAHVLHREFPSLWGRSCYIEGQKGR